jgi:hypothetical protein
MGWLLAVSIVSGPVVIREAVLHCNRISELRFRAYEPLPQASSDSTPAVTLHSAMFSKLRRRIANNPSSTPLSHLLTSNNPPSDVEETLVRNTIQSMRGEITALKLEIDSYSSHPRSVATLEDRKATTIRNITAHESIISPWRRLPPELLQVIFLQTHRDPQTTSTLPWSLSQVCQSWRTIVHDTPVLWNYITINFNKKPTKLRPQEDRLKLILQRSGNVDLRILISGLMNQGDKRLSLLLILIAQSERWRYLNLTAVTATTVMAFQDVKGRLPRLSGLHLKFWRTKEPINIIDIDMFSIAPRLKKVTIDNDNDHFRVIVPLHQLSSYVRRGLPGQIGTLNGNSLLAFSNLVYLEIYCDSIVTDSWEPCIILPRLEVLVITFSLFNTANHPAKAFFERLILPSIREIGVHGPAYGAILAIPSMILRSLPCDLRSLSITTLNSTSPGHLTSLLHLTPQLEHLEIPLPPRRDLSNLLESSVLAPRLQSLRILMLDSSLLSYFHSTASIAILKMLSNAEEFRTLRTLQLKFTTESRCRDGYFAIQPSPQIGELDGEVLSLINSWKHILLEGIPHLSRCPTPHKILFNLMHWRQLDQLFSTIEGYDISTSGYLHVRGFLPSTEY